MRLSLELPEKLECIRMTRLLSRALLEGLGVHTEDIYAVELITSELCANVVRHARSAEGRFQVMVEYDRGTAVITVEDHGHGFIPDAVPPPGTTRPDNFATAPVGSTSAVSASISEPQRIGGFGLPLVTALSDRIAFETAGAVGTRVRAEKMLRMNTSQAAV